MKKLFIALFAVFAMIAVDVDAKSFGGSRSSFGGSRSVKFSAPKPSPKPAYVAPKPAPAPVVAPAPAPVVNKAVPSTFSKPAVATGVVAGAATAGVVATTATTSPTPTTAPKAVSTNAVDTKIAKSTAITTPTYKTKAEAETAYRASLTSSNKYTSATPPSTRPANIPEKVSVGGSNVTVVYNQVPGGGYGYGYVDPMTHTFVTLAATHMMIDAMSMNNHGYAYAQPVVTQPVVRQPVVVQESTGVSVMKIILLSVLVGGVILFIIWFIVKAE